MPTKVLIVDDDSGFASVMQERLEHSGYSVSAITTGHDMFQHLRLEETHIIVLDLMLPDVGGIQCLKMIKEAYPEMQVIILTGMRDNEVEKLARQFGAHAYLKKPCSGAILLDAINGAAQKIKQRKKEAGDDPSTPTR